MLSWSGQRQGKPITNIREENELIYFNVYPENYTANRSSSLKTDNLKIYSDSDNIYIINNDTEDIRFSVYNTMGISIKEGILSDNSQISINVTRGMYIIKCNDSTHKLNVR